MITITREYLDENWKVLANSILPTAFSDWDNGDAYTLASLGQFPSPKIVFAAVVLGNKEVADFPLVIRLHKQGETSSPGCYRSPLGNFYKVTGEMNSGEISKIIEVKIADLGKDLSSRRHGLIETDLLKSMSVFIIGLGTGGVQIALDLAKAGVGKFSLMDADRLEIGNVSRHHAGISLVGRRKVAAVKDLILEKNPSIEIETYPLFATIEQKEVLKAIVERSSLVICATDNRQSKLLINEICVKLRKSVIFGGAFRRAYGGQVFRSAPGDFPCYHCFVLAMPDKEADMEISSQRNADAIAYSDRPVAVEPGLSIDVTPIANMVSKLAVMELIKGKDSTLHMLDKDFTAPWYFWVNRPEPNTEYATIPPLSDSSDGDGITILRWYGVYLAKDPGCPTCGNFAGAIRKQYGLAENDGSALLPLPPLSYKSEETKI